ncbi:hypothetical protein [Helicobacter sp. T3_23-1056]
MFWQCDSAHCYQKSKNTKKLDLPRKHIVCDGKTHAKAPSAKGGDFRLPQPRKLDCHADFFKIRSQ